MLVWRLIVGIGLACLTIYLAWVDIHLSRPGLALCPLAILAAFAGANEMVRLFEAADHRRAKELSTNLVKTAPSRYVVATGATITVLFSLAPLFIDSAPTEGPIGRIGWISLGIACSVVLAVISELIRYQSSGVASLRLAQGIMAIVYVGGLMGCVCHLRLLDGGPWGHDGKWGMIALISTLAIAKTSDVGAYSAGKLFGRHRMTPLLSPGKTWEGAAGGLAGSLVAAFICLGPLTVVSGCVTHVSTTRWVIGILIYAIAVGVAGVAGDLAISMLKRDSGVKDSSTWLPGLGGILDLVDSILLAAPVALFAWLGRLVGP